MDLNAFNHCVLRFETSTGFESERRTFGMFLNVSPEIWSRI